MFRLERSMNGEREIVARETNLRQIRRLMNNTARGFAACCRLAGLPVRTLIQPFSVSLFVGGNKVLFNVFSEEAV